MTLSFISESDEEPFQQENMDDKTLMKSPKEGFGKRIVQISDESDLDEIKKPKLSFKTSQKNNRMVESSSSDESTYESDDQAKKEMIKSNLSLLLKRKRGEETSDEEECPASTSRYQTRSNRATLEHDADDLKSDASEEETTERRKQRKHRRRHTSPSPEPAPLATETESESDSDPDVIEIFGNAEETSTRGKLWCFMCSKLISEDSFSARERKNPRSETGHPFCLAHSWAAAQSGPVSKKEEERISTMVGRVDIEMERVRFREVEESDSQGDDLDGFIEFGT